MSKRFKVFIITLLLILVPIVLLFALESFRDSENKRILLLELNHKLLIPAGCFEKSRTYAKSSVGHPSTFSLRYDCMTSADSTYNEIISNLKSLNYHQISDFVADKKGAKDIYVFTYKKEAIETNYTFVSEYCGLKYWQCDTSSAENLDVKHIILHVRHY